MKQKNTFSVKLNTGSTSVAEVTAVLRCVEVLTIKAMQLLT